MTEATRRQNHLRVYSLFIGATITAIPLAAPAPPGGKGHDSVLTAAHPELTLRLHPEDMVTSIAVSPDGSNLAAGTRYGDCGGVEIWDLTSGKLRWAAAGYNGGVWSVAYSPEGRLLASGGEDGSLRLWDVTTGKLRRRFGRRGLAIQSVAFSPDGRSLASAGGDWLEDQIAELKLWDVRTGRLRRSRRKPGYFLNLVAYLPAGNLLPSHDREVVLLQLWDTQPGRRPGLVVGYGPALSALSPDRRILAAEHDGGAVELLDARTFAPLRELVPYEPDLRAVAFSPDGRTVATAAGAGRVNKLELWDARTGKLQKSISISGKTVWALAYQHSGRVLVSGDEQGALDLWDARSGRLLSTLHLLSWPGERSAVAQWLAFTSNSYYDGSPGVERSIRWRVGDQLYPAARYERTFHRPDLVRRVLHSRPEPTPIPAPGPGE